MKNYGSLSPTLRSSERFTSYDLDSSTVTSTSSDISTPVEDLSCPGSVSPEDNNMTASATSPIPTPIPADTALFNSLLFYLKIIKHWLN